VLQVAALQVLQDLLGQQEHRDQKATSGFLDQQVLLARKVFLELQLPWAVLVLLDKLELLDKPDHKAFRGNPAQQV
jgi:hypothetical protein